jgi:hypothetical protein
MVLIEGFAQFLSVRARGAALRLVPQQLQRGILIFAIFLTSACGTMTETEIASISLVTDSTAYDVGSLMQVTATNFGSESYGIRACGVRLERSTVSGWGGSELPGDCVDATRQLAPGGSIEYEFVVPGGTAGGTYRLFFPELKQGSNSFLVR